MKIAITAKGIRLDSEVDPRFGRAPYILIVDTETLAFEAVDNSENVNAFKGAGIKAAGAAGRPGSAAVATEPESARNSAGIIRRPVTDQSSPAASSLPAGVLSAASTARV